MVGSVRVLAASRRRSRPLWYFFCFRLPDPCRTPLGEPRGWRSEEGALLCSDSSAQTLAITVLDETVMVAEDVVLGVVETVGLVIRLWDGDAVRDEVLRDAVRDVVIPGVEEATGDAVRIGVREVVVDAVGTSVGDGDGAAVMGVVGGLEPNRLVGRYRTHLGIWKQVLTCWSTPLSL